MLGITPQLYRPQGTYFPPHHPQLVDYAIAHTGVVLASGDVDSWTTMIGRSTMTPASSAARPKYAKETGLWRGFPAIQTETLLSSRLNVSSLASGKLPLAGTRPYVVGIGRLRSVGAGTQVVYTFTSSGSSVVILNWQGGNTRWQMRNPLVGTELYRAGAPGTDPFFYESWADGANMNSRFNGAANSTANTGSLIADLNSITIGNGASPSDSSHQFIGIWSAKPSDNYIKRLKLWARDMFGTSLA